MLNIIIFGPPGTGKGTQSANIIQKYNLVHLSTGDIMRDEIAKGTKIGMLAKKYIDKGELVPDRVIFRQLFIRAAEHKDPRGYIFDGFPRNITQAETLDKILIKNQIPVSIVIYIDVAEDELFRRIMHRGSHSQRSDDNVEVVHKRIAVYNGQTFPLLDYYQSQGKLVRVNGMGSIDEVFADICRHIDAHLAQMV